MRLLTLLVALCLLVVQIGLVSCEKVAVADVAGSQHGGIDVEFGLGAAERYGGVKPDKQAPSSKMKVKKKKGKQKGKKKGPERGICHRF